MLKLAEEIILDLYHIEYDEEYVYLEGRKLPIETFRKEIDQYL